MTGFFKKKGQFCARLMAVVLLSCLTCGGGAQKNGFRGGAKSYEIHVEASAIGTNLHYDLPQAKVKATGKAKQEWLVDNDNAEMIAMNSPVLAVVSVKHPKFNTKGQWPGYKLKFEVPKDASKSGAKKMNFVRPTNSYRHTALVVDKDESSGIGGKSASGSGSDLISPQNEESVDSKLRPNTEIEQGAEGVRKLARSPDKRNSREITDESKSANKPGFSLQKFSGLLLPLEKLNNLQLKNPAVKDEMETIVAHAKKVVTEAKTVLKDAASFVKNVKSLVHGGRNVQLKGIADYARKAVEEVGSGELGLLREGIAIAKGPAASLGAPAKHAAKPAKHAGLHLHVSEPESQETEKDGDSGIANGSRRVAAKTSKLNGEAKTAGDVHNDLNDERRSSNNSQPKTGEIRKRRDSNFERENEPKGRLESFFSSLENLKDLLGLHRK